MGLFDKIKAYLNEESEEKKESKKSKRAVEENESGEKKTVEPSRKLVSDRETVLDFCEQLIDTKKHMLELKQEYRIVTDYLSDIQRIEELPVELAQDIVNTAKQVERLDNARSTYLQSEKLLPLEQYNLMQARSEEAVDAIKNLNEMEMRDTVLKKDMGHLEGEKEDLKYIREECVSGIEHLRMIVITVLVLFMFTSAGLFLYASNTHKNVMIYALGVGAIAMFAFVIAYARYVDLKHKIKETDAKINRAISLLNKVKVKYINNVNTMDYVYEKYKINSSVELEYRYEQYNTMVRDEKRYYQTSTELRNYETELAKKLTRIGLKDAEVWIGQVGALIRRDELDQIKSSLRARRKNLQDQMVVSDKIIDNAKTALLASVDGNPGMQDIIDEKLGPEKISLSE